LSGVDAQPVKARRARLIAELETLIFFFLRLRGVLNRLLHLECLLQNLVVIRRNDSRLVVIIWLFLASDGAIGWKHCFSHKDVKLFARTYPDEPAVTGFAVEQLI